MRKCDPLDGKGFWIADLFLTDVNTIKNLFEWEGVKLLQEHLDWAVCHIENIPLAQACLELGALPHAQHFKSAQNNVQMMILQSCPCFSIFA